MRVTSPKKVGQAKDGKFTTYRDAVNYLLETYASDDVIAKAEGNLRPLVQTPCMTPTDYAILLSKQVFRCGMVYSESSMLGIYIEGLHESIRGAVRTYWSEHTKADINKIARHATKVAKLTGHTKSGIAARNDFNIEYDGNSSTTAGSSRHTHTLSDDAGSAHKDLPNRATAEDDVILASELLLIKLHGATAADLKSSSIIDSGDFCRICFCWREHLTSACPYLQRKAGFVEARNSNFDQFIRNRRPYQGYRGGRNGRFRGD